MIKSILLICLFYSTGSIYVYAQNSSFISLQEKYESNAIYLTSGPLLDLYSLHKNSNSRSQLTSLDGGTNLPLLFSFLSRIGGSNISHNISFLKIDLMRKKAAYISPENNQGNLTILTWNEKQVEDIAIWIDKFLTFSNSYNKFISSLNDSSSKDIKLIWSEFINFNDNIFISDIKKNILFTEVRNYLDADENIESISLISNESQLRNEIINFQESYDMLLFKNSNFNFNPKNLNNINNNIQEK